MTIKDRMSGNQAIATAIRQINPDVIAAFPITPSTEIPQFVSSMKAEGLVDTEFIAVESEHSAMSACIGASAAGVRAMTATSSAGMALMYELLYVAASDRLPIVLAAVNRALTGPININADHSDSMGARDSGWIQIYSENAQEAYDNMLMAHRIAEDPAVSLPVMICQDGFITSHAIENILIEEDAPVRAFIGEYVPVHHLLQPDKSVGVGPYSISAFYMEMKRAQFEAMRNARAVIRKVSDDFGAKFGRQYGMFEEYRMEDAELAVLLMSSSAGTGKDAVDALREQGVKAGLVKLRVFRPFPAEDLAFALKDLKALAIMDKSDGFSGNGGPLGAEVRAAIYGVHDGIKTINYVYGLGGRDIRVDDFFTIFGVLEELLDGRTTDRVRHIGVREK
ncbi:MAG: pyruvate ferredoxin oxidoreductase [Clostridiales Family XIII bacterium]|jgi:pyruvate ferredoxin oxidoreductase alpha subunit|nr:pyruvate ferredoxin oxidoreductase [Clostridiales Family XIII bacterium]